MPDRDPGATGSFYVTTVTSRTMEVPVHPVPALVLLACLLLSACGSRLSPADVAAAGGAGGVVAGGAEGDGVSVGAPAGGDVLAGGPGGLPGSAGSGTTTGGDPGTTGASADDPAAGPGGDPVAGTRAGSCEGFRNQTGITDEAIVVANASDLSGPVPGLFEPARLGTAAFLAYFNSRSDVCGRELRMLELDSKTDSAADQAAYTRACDEAFAAVGSASIFDSGGARTAEECGLPDLRSNILTRARADCATCFAAQSLQPGVITDAAYQFYSRQDREATQSAAFLYLDVGGSPELARSFADAAESTGFVVKLIRGIGTSEFNYAPFVQELKDEGITFVSFTGPTQSAVRLVTTMQQQGYRPDQLVVTQTQYGPQFPAEAGEAAEGAMAPVPHPAFTAGNREVDLYVQWLAQVKPDAPPSTFGLFAWSAARLFAERAVALGGRLTRESLLAAVRGVREWTAGGMHAPMDVGGKRSFTCSTVVQLQDGEWRQISGDGYTCGKLVTTSVA